MSSAPNIAVVGATGAVGREFLKVLHQRNFPMSGLHLLASSRSAGRSIEFAGKSYTVELLAEESFDDIDLALFGTDGPISRKFAPIASESGCTVVDNSSAFRMTDGVPLVIPEINAEAVNGFAPGKGGIIANPNCSTIIMLVPVTPLHRAAIVQRIVVSTYQAASGAGAEAMDELEQQTREVLEGKPPTCNVFSQQYAFNLFSHDSQIGDDGYNTEESKMVHETAKIWANPHVRVTATCIRVPVLRAHAESINIQFEKPIGDDEARQILSESPGVSILDDRQNNRFPTPIDVSGKDDVYVGRIRNDRSRNSSTGGSLDLFVCGDQLRKGAALNAVQIAELIL